VIIFALHRRKAILMDASAITALAALLGAATGGLTSLLATWLSQRRQIHAQLLGQDLVRRQELYRDFIEDASRCYVHALQHDEPDVPAWSACTQS